MKKEIEIPEGYEARIEGNKVILELKESEDEEVRKWLIGYIKDEIDDKEFTSEGVKRAKKAIAYLEKQKEQKSNLELIKQSWYSQGYTDGKFKREPMWNIKTGKGGPRYEKNEKYGQPLEQKPAEKQDYSELTDLERAIHRGFLVAGVENVPVTIIKETAKECLARMEPAAWSEDYREEDIQTRFAFYTYKDDPSILYLSNVFVEETSRNHGFGTRILKAAEKVAEAIGAITICLKVKQDSPANAWYRKRGYGYMTFEGEYDWLEKNLEYLKPAKLKDNLKKL